MLWLSDDVYAEEALRIGLVDRTEDVKEGRAAFRERRQPEFKGR